MDARAPELLRLISEFRDQTHPSLVGRPSRPISVSDSLERDLGFDSLARSELLLRMEARFGVRLPEGTLGSAETPADLLAALVDAQGNDQRAAAVPATIAEPQPTALAEGGLSIPGDIATLVDALVWHATHQPERIHLVHLSGEGVETPMSYGELWRWSLAVAAGLQQHDLASGEAVALMLPTGPEFFPCFLGILIAGGVPVPIYPPARPSQIEDHLRRHGAILANADARLLITTAEAVAAAGLLRGQVECLRAVVLADELIKTATAPTLVPAHAGDLALLQYTSGSTGLPKGVMLTHANLLANMRAMARAAEVTPADVFVSWLPLYHDMGLICAWLSSLAFGVRFVVMSPLAFLASPERWLWAIHRHRGTLSGAPNFAYELCLRKIGDERLRGLDLSSWRIAFNGAEPVSPETMARFAERFAPYALKPEALAPVYGLAECAVGLALTPNGGARADRIERGPFVTEGRAVPAAVDATDVLQLAICGRPLPGHEIRIVDATGAELPERQEGRIEFRGPSVTAGYFRNPEATRKLRHGDWLDSGDYGYLAGGEVVVSGRAKDIIIKGGRNIYPQELEETVGNVPGIRKGCVAVFGSPDPAVGTERLVVAAECRPDAKADVDQLRSAIQDVVISVLGMPADDVVISTGHIVLKTSSGKIRRAASRELYESGGAAAPRAVWLQVSRLLLAGFGPRLRRTLRGLGAWLYGARFWVLMGVLTPPTWLATVLLPRPGWRWAAAHLGARVFLRAAGIKLKVVGREHLATDDPVVLVVNHASYFDGLFLVAALPYGRYRFVAKRELVGGFVPRLFLRGLGCEFVERFDFQQGVADAARLAEAVGAGDSLVVFAEGTFTRVPGLAPFRMGAFVVAAQTGAPVLPLALRGSRDLLRDEHWLPRCGDIAVTIGAPIRPAGTDWAAAVALRDAARREILRHCGEPDLVA